MRSPYACAHRGGCPTPSCWPSLQPDRNAFSDYQAFVRDSLGEPNRRRDPPAAAGHRGGSQYNVMTGYPARQLKPYVDTFGRDRVEVILNEDLRDDAKAVLDRSLRVARCRPDAETAELMNQFMCPGRPRNAAVASPTNCAASRDRGRSPSCPNGSNGASTPSLATGLKRETVSRRFARNSSKSIERTSSCLQTLIDREISRLAAARGRFAEGRCSESERHDTTPARVRTSCHRSRQVGDDLAELLPASASAIFFARERESHHFSFLTVRLISAARGTPEEFVPLIISDRDRYLSCFAGATPAQICGGPRSITRASRSLSAQMPSSTTPT